MGLSRKLAGQSKSEPEDEQFQWSTQCYTLSEIIEKFKVPRVVQCTSTCIVKCSQFEFDLKQPLLVYSRRQTKKVHARSLKYDEDTQLQESFGPPVIIPEDYDGWFTVMNSTDDSLPRHTRIETIAGCPSDRFLVATHLPVLIHAPGPNGEVHYVVGEVTPGEVLSKTGLCESDADMCEVMPLLKKGKPCLRCSDEKHDDLVIPFQHRAKMFEVSDDTSAAPQGLVRISHVVETSEALFPFVVRLAFGEPPAVSYTFTGDLKLERVFEEESVLASTLDKESPFPLEIKTDSKVKFFIALNEADIKRTSAYTNASNACEELGDKYLTGMKVSFTLQPEMVPLEPLDWSMSESDVDNGNDADDVDAQSEFEINWDPDRTSSLVSLSDGHEKSSKPDVIEVDDRGFPSHNPGQNDQNNFIQIKSAVTNNKLFLEGMTEEMV